MDNKMLHNQNLILLGHKSCGKTYFGRLFSQEFACQFIDTDLLVEKSYEDAFGQRLNCRQICLKIGEPAFRCLESQVIDQLLGVKNAIISLGGGAVLNAQNCSKLSGLGKLVYLEAGKEIIKQRILKDVVPSFLNAADLENSFERMYEERKPIYERVSEYKVILDGQTDQQILDELKRIFY